MKNSFKENHKLPLTFIYAKIIKKSQKRRKRIYFMSCSKFQTDFFTIEKPYKPLTRLL